MGRLQGSGFEREDFHGADSEQCKLAFLHEKGIANYIALDHNAYLSGW